EEHSGVASGINDTFRQVGVATGVAALGALFVAQIADRIAELLPGTTDAQADELAEAVSSGALPPDAPAPALAAAQEGFLSGLNEILIVGAVLAFVGAALTLLLVRTGDLRESEPLAEPAA
ncbi:MAG: hypothetical protein LC777_10625, partial [Actinobacteria bacterium]|nr:hypothetical protein [Actinomycetota bacterium]